MRRFAQPTAKQTERTVFSKHHLSIREIWWPGYTATHTHDTHIDETKDTKRYDPIQALFRSV